MKEGANNSRDAISLDPVRSLGPIRDSPREIDRRSRRLKEATRERYVRRHHRVDSVVVDIPETFVRTMIARSAKREAKRDSSRGNLELCRKRYEEPLRVFVQLFTQRE